MQTIIWAIGSMAVLMLISFFIPLGYSFKGKVLVVITSFLLSLVGLLSLTILPFWETGLILFALVFIAAYLMNSRMEPFIIKLDEEVFEMDADFGIDHHQISQSSSGQDDDILLELNKDPLLTITSKNNLEIDLLADSNSLPITNDLNDIRESELIDEDITMMLSKETYDKEEIEFNKPKDDYISDIESLIEIENEVKHVEMLDDLDELQPLNLEEKIPLKNEEPEDQWDEDSLFDFLLAEKEVAVEIEDVTKEKIIVQK